MKYFLFFLLLIIIIFAGCKNYATQNEDGSYTYDGYKGKALAYDSKSPYLEFNQEDYEKATNEGKVILLNFYAIWCDDCKNEQENAIEAFNKINDNEVIGFQVNYRDTNTDEFESNLAKKYSVPHQYTKIIIKNEEILQKFTNEWAKETYIQELKKY